MNLNKLTEEIDEMEKELLMRTKSIQEATEKTSGPNYFG